MLVWRKHTTYGKECRIGKRYDSSGSVRRSGSSEGPSGATDPRGSQTARPWIRPPRQATGNEECCRGRQAATEAPQDQPRGSRADCSRCAGALGGSSEGQGYRRVGYREEAGAQEEGVAQGHALSRQTKPSAPQGWKKAAILPLQCSFGLGDQPFYLRQDLGFELRVVANPGIEGGHACDGGVQPIKQLAADTSGNFGAVAE
jgi:hypothetical protein